MTTTILTKSYLRGRWLWEAEAEGKVVESGWAATPEEAEASYLAWSLTYVAPPPAPVAVRASAEAPCMVKDPIDSENWAPLNAYPTITATPGSLLKGLSVAPADYSWAITSSGGATYGPNMVSMMQRGIRERLDNPTNPNGTFKSEKKENLGGVIWNALGEMARPFLAGLDSVDKKLALTPVVTGAHKATDYEVLRNQLCLDARLVRRRSWYADDVFGDHVTAMARQLAEVLPDVIKACGGVLHQFHAPSLLNHGLDPTNTVCYNMTFQWLVMKSPPAAKPLSTDMREVIQSAMSAMEKRNADMVHNMSMAFYADPWGYPPLPVRWPSKAGDGLLYGLTLTYTEE